MSQSDQYAERRISSRRATERSLLAALRAWGLTSPVMLQPLDDAMNSYAWRVGYGKQLFVLKSVEPERSSQFEASLQVAEYLEKVAIPAGGPIRTLQGDLTAQLDDQTVALLRYVRGQSVDPTNLDAMLAVAHGVGRAHEALISLAPPSGLRRWQTWLADHAEFAVRQWEPWVLPTLERAVSDALAASRGLTIGVVHADLAFENILLDDMGRVGLIDWASAMVAPLVYDLAVLKIFYDYSVPRPQGTIDFERILHRYLTTSPVREAEFAVLDVFIRLRWAVQARYCSWRIALDVTRGFDASGNEIGLRAAQRALGLPAA